jgi:hypothetical protein
MAPTTQRPARRADAAVDSPPASSAKDRAEASARGVHVKDVLLLLGPVALVLLGLWIATWGVRRIPS